MPISDFGEII